MRRVLRSIADFLLYSHLFVACCAVCISLLTSLLYTGQFEITEAHRFIFTSTIGLYCIHRLVGLHKVHNHLGENRFKIIKPFHWLLVGFILISLPFSGYIYFQFDAILQKLLILPAILSIAYVIPIWGNMRLRDISYIKLFIIALVWSFITVIIPVWESPILQNTQLVYLICLERFLFILAITLPFDIRDINVDKILKVKTLPMHFGIARAKYISYVCLVLAAITILIISNYLPINPGLIIGYFIGMIITLLLIRGVHEERSDYYFSGWMDGTMIIIFLLTWAGSYLPLSFH